MNPASMDLARAPLPPQSALSRWENEGGAPADGLRGRTKSNETLSEVPVLTNAELAQLRVRVIALENVIIALLTKGSEEQLQMVRELAAYIAPRPGFTPHPLTTRASAEMIHLVERSVHFRDTAVS